MAQRNQKTLKAVNKKLCAVSTLLLSLMIAGTVRADMASVNLTETDEDTRETAVETHRHASVQSGYRFITPDGPPGAASPYGRLASGVTGGFSAGSLGPDLKLAVDGNFLHEDDYHSELFFDYRGLIRFHAESGALWHNLLNEQLPKGIESPTLLIDQRDKGMIYGVRTAVSQVDTRLKLGNNPFHLNLGYWELSRNGYEQLRFSDHYFGTAVSKVIAEPNRVDRITREGSIGLDGHLGLFDLSYGFRIRDFSNEAADPRSTYSNSAGGALNINPGMNSHAHDVIPDSRVTSHTIKLFSDLSGGLVGSASYNLTQRENSGSRGDAVPSERPSDVIQSAAGDLSYTPSKRHSFALKYRHREIDRTTPASVYYPYSQSIVPSPGIYTSVPGELLVRPATSSLKDTLTFSATFRPAPRVIYRLEYNAELETRDNVRDAQSLAGSPTALHSDSRQTHTGTATFYWKPVNGVKVNTSYSYAACDNPAYGASFGDRHTGKLLLTYALSGKWGVTGNYLVQLEKGERSAWVIPPANLAISTGSASSLHNLPRETLSNSANVSVWFSPLERLVITTSYSYLQAEISQTSLLTELSRNALAAARYSSASHLYSIDASYAAGEQVDLSLAFQQVFSRSSYDVPPIAEFSATDSTGITTLYSTTGITDMTKLASTETGASARVDWRITALLGCSLDYSFRRYESGQPLYNGSVHSTMVSLKARW